MGEQRIDNSLQRKAKALEDKMVGGSEANVSGSISDARNSRKLESLKEKQHSIQLGLPEFLAITVDVSA